MSTGESSGGAGGAGVEFATMRGRDYPTIRQFTVFLENRVGQLLEVVRRFEGSHVRIVALTITDSTECAIVRFLLSDPEQGREVLERAGLAIVESDLIGVKPFAASVSSAISMLSTIKATDARLRGRASSGYTWVMFTSACRSAVHTCSIG